MSTLSKRVNYGVYFIIKGASLIEPNPMNACYSKLLARKCTRHIIPG